VIQWSQCDAENTCSCRLVYSNVMLKTQCHAIVGWSISRIQHERYFNKYSSTPDKLTSGQYTTRQVDASSIDHAVRRRVFSRRCSVDVRQVDARQIDSIPYWGLLDISLDNYRPYNCFAFLKYSKNEKDFVNLFFICRPT